jgi:hypothetical protein
MKYHLFIDETGDPSLRSISENFSIFVLAGCLFSDEAYQEMSEKIYLLKKGIFGSNNIILHGRDIRKCEGVFAKLFDLKVKEEFYTLLNTIIEEVPFKVIAVAIKKKEFIEKYGKLADDPYELSLSFLLERAIMATDDEVASKVHVIVESRGCKEDGILMRRYNRLIDVGTSQITSDRFKDRFETFQFNRKEQNDCGLQIADLCAYPIARHLLHPDIFYPAFDIVERKIRKGGNGSITGFGLKVFP